MITDYEKTLIINATKDTIYLLLVSGLFLIVIGLILGILLFITRSDNYETPNKLVKTIHFILGGFIDITRSIPFIILMITIIPLTIIITGTMLGANAALPALVISASPFYGRIVYNSLREIDRGKIEALKSLGANKFTIIKYLIKEALHSLISGLSVTLVSLVGFIAAAGAVGAGGLGDLARRRALALDYKLVYISVGILLLIVLIIQITGDFITKKIDKR